jgi:hypothetical protein
MNADPFETTNVIDKYPEVADKLKKIAEEHRKEFFPNAEDPKPDVIK